MLSRLRVIIILLHDSAPRPSRGRSVIYVPILWTPHNCINCINCINFIVRSKRWNIFVRSATRIQQRTANDSIKQKYNKHLTFIDFYHSNSLCYIDLFTILYMQDYRDTSYFVSYKNAFIQIIFQSLKIQIYKLF